MDSSASSDCGLRSDIEYSIAHRGMAAMTVQRGARAIDQWEPLRQLTTLRGRWSSSTLQRASPGS